MNEVTRFFKALADPTRLRIVLLLLGRDLCVCELTFVLGMSQSRISHQLRLLRDAGLVEDKRDGKWMIYGIPVRVKTSLRPLIGVFGRRHLASSGPILRDLRNLKICQKKDIRGALATRRRQTRRRSNG